MRLNACDQIGVPVIPGKVRQRKTPPRELTAPYGLPHLSSEHVISNVLIEDSISPLLSPCLGQRQGTRSKACSLWFSYLGTPHCGMCLTPRTQETTLALRFDLSPSHKRSAPNLWKLESYSQMV